MVAPTLIAIEEPVDPASLKVVHRSTSLEKLKCSGKVRSLAGRWEELSVNRAPPTPTTSANSTISPRKKTFPAFPVLQQTKETHVTSDSDTASTAAGEAPPARSENLSSESLALNLPAEPGASEAEDSVATAQDRSQEEKEVEERPQCFVDLAQDRSEEEKEVEETPQCFVDFAQDRSEEEKEVEETPQCFVDLAQDHSDEEQEVQETPRCFVDLAQDHSDEEQEVQETPRCFADLAQDRSEEEQEVKKAPQYRYELPEVLVEERPLATSRFNRQDFAFEDVPEIKEALRKAALEASQRRERLAASRGSLTQQQRAIIAAAESQKVRSARRSLGGVTKKP